MPIVCPFQFPLPPPKPYHEVIFEHFDDYGDDVALEEDSKTEKESLKLTYRQVRQLTRNVANNLQKLGFKKGDVMAFYLENRIAFAPLFLAVSSLGGAVTGVNPLYRVEELARQLKDSGSKFVFTKKSLLKTVKEASVGLPIRHFVLIDGPVNDVGTVPFSELCKGDYHQLPDVKIDVKEDVVIIPYSSGTTGLPKGVMLTHANLNCRFYANHSLGVFRVGSRYGTIITFLPFFHMMGFMTIFNAMHTGNFCVLMTKFDTLRYVELTAKHKAMIVHGVPSVLVYLIKSKDVEKYDLSHVVGVAFGAAPSGPELIEGLKKKFPNLMMIYQGYGMTESSGVASSTPSLPIDQYPIGSCGIPIPNCEFKVITTDGTNRELGPMETGEICMRGPLVMKGYINNEKATRETVDADGWLHSGDLGYYDFFGHIYIVDRLKELIKYKAYQVAPAELEDVILKHPAVEEVAVVGLPDPKEPDIGEMVTAFVLLKQGHKPSNQLEDDIKKLVADHLAPYKHLRGGVKFCREMLKGPSGKIMRREIRDGKIQLLETPHVSKL